MDLFLLFCFVLLSLIHKFLSIFWEQGNLPYNFGFTLFYMIFIISVAINSVHYFGWVSGIILTLLIISGIIYNLYLMPIFSIFLNVYIKIPGNFCKDAISWGRPLVFNNFAYLILGLWGCLIPIFLICSIINLFMSENMLGIEMLKTIGLVKFAVYSIIYFIFGLCINFVFALHKR